jgi:hypothetical protein
VRRFMIAVLAGPAVVAVAFGSGIAGAINEYQGATYEQVVEAVGSNGSPPAWLVIAGRTGSYLPTEKCVVSSSRTDRKSGNLYLYLNCNDVVAGAHAGASVATEGGKKAASIRKWTAYLQTNYEDAIASGEKPSLCGGEISLPSCLNACRNSGTCSKDFLEYLDS